MNRKITWALMPALSLALSASAIESAAQPPGGGTLVGSVTVPCCRCIGGESQRVSINTGGSLAWRVAGPGVVGTVAQTITNNIPSLWTANLAPARWVHPNNNNGSAAEPGGVYRYEIRIVVPHCVIPMRVMLQGRAAADDQLRGFIDNNPNPIATTPTNAIASPPPVGPGAPGWGFRAERIASFSVPLGPGVHVLRFEVLNGSPGPTGLLVNGALTTQCSTVLQND